MNSRLTCFQFANRVENITGSLEHSRRKIYTLSTGADLLVIFGLLYTPSDIH